MKVELMSCTPCAEELCAMAANGCYSNKPSCDIVLNKDKIIKILKNAVSSGHLSVLEHAVFTFSVSGVSRSLTHQLVRHRLASFSQMSQRYVNMDDASYITPHTIDDTVCVKDFDTNISRMDLFEDAMTTAWCTYNSLIKSGVPEEDARYVLPNACTTNITITMNARELLHFFELRCCNRCYDSATEVLTKRGWIKFKDVNMNDEFYSLNPDTHNCEFAGVRCIIDEEYTGNMVMVDAQSVDLLITPNHKNYVSYSYDNKKFHLDSAENSMNHKMVLMKKNCVPIPGQTPDYILLPSVVREKNNQYATWQYEYPERNVDAIPLLRLLGMYLANGCCIQAGQHYNVCLSINAKDEDKIEFYKKVMEQVSDHKPQVIKPYKGAVTLKLHDSNLFMWLKPLGHAKEKRIPDFIWDLDHTLLVELFDGMCDGDANQSRTAYYTSSKEMADDMQRLLLHIGMSGKVTEIPPRSHKIPDGRMIKGGESYQVSINRSKNEPIIKTAKRNAFSNVLYDGRIHCVELDKNHTLYVRRHGKAVWSGNSQLEIREMADKMLVLCKERCPIIFENAGPKCRTTGCTEANPCGNPRV
ncbi:MAG: FAD-dependent thymidylate synthase [Candidatus Dojkabacteria bacterium]